MRARPRMVQPAACARRRASASLALIAQSRRVLHRQPRHRRRRLSLRVCRSRRPLQRRQPLPRPSPWKSRLRRRPRRSCPLRAAGVCLLLPAHRTTRRLRAMSRLLSPHRRFLCRQLLCRRHSRPSLQSTPRLRTAISRRVSSRLRLHSYCQPAPLRSQ